MRTKAILVAGFWLFVFGGFGVYRHNRYLHRLAGYGPKGPGPEPLIGLDQVDPNMPGMPLRQALLVSWTRTLPYLNASSYLLRPSKKEPDRIRVGLFGDSHIEGVEAAKDFDLPTLLQKRFRA